MNDDPFLIVKSGGDDTSLHTKHEIADANSPAIFAGGELVPLRKTSSPSRVGFFAESPIPVATFFFWEKTILGVFGDN